jgi:hypothetical protein
VGSKTPDGCETLDASLDVRLLFDSCDNL